MMPPRPSRYRVVERGRRLEVIDTWADGKAPAVRGRERPMLQANPPRTIDASHRAPPAPGRAAPTTGPRRGAGHSHARVFTTSSWYDAKGPRPIVLGEAGESRLKGLQVMAVMVVIVALVMSFVFFPLVIFGGFFALTRIGVIRKGIATYLDNINQPAETVSGSDG